MHLKLTNAEGSFFDPETNLMISGDEVVDAGDQLGELTKRYLGVKRLARAEAPTEGKAKSAPKKTAKLNP